MISNPASAIPPISPVTPRAFDLLEHILDGGPRGPGVGRESLQWRTGVYRLQAVQENADEPNPYLRGARISARTLQLVPVAIDPHHIFAANGILDGGSAAERWQAWETLQSGSKLVGHSGHIALDYTRLLRLGVRGLLAEIDAQARQIPPDDLTDEASERRSLYAAMRLALDGFLHYAERHRLAGERLLAMEPDPQRCAELTRMERALARVPREPASTLYEAIQSFLLYHFAIRTQEGDTAVGRLDYYLDPYYQADLAAGRITREEAAEFMQMLLVHLRELTPFSDAVVLAGVNAAGEPFSNDLTYFVLDAMERLRIPNPEIGLRIYPRHDRELLRRGMRLVTAGTGHPGFFNDIAAIDGLQRAGFSAEDARNYVNCNCVELSAAGCSCVLSGYNYTNLAKPVEILLNGGTHMVREEGWGEWYAAPSAPSDMPTTFPTFADFFAAYDRMLSVTIAELVEHTNITLASQRQGTFMPLSSCLIDGCITGGKLGLHGGARYNQTFPSFSGFLNAVDSLAAIRHAVYEQQRLTLEELAECCWTNFAGQEDVRQYLLRECPKYGNDDPQTDALATWLFNRVAEELARYTNIFGEVYAPQYFGFVTHGRRGSVTAATPDGRREGDAVSGTLGGDSGTDISGPTALLLSATSFDHSLAPGGISLNLAFSPTALRGEEDNERVIDMILAYFALGGMQLQFNYTDAAILQAARQAPEQHRNLLVRVAGYTDTFVDLERNVQEQIMQRTFAEVM